MQRRNWPILEFRLEIGLSRSKATEKDSIVFESTISIGSVSFGEVAMLTM
jgi:hypothetical protein